ncbi:MAG: STAS domain-containing protein [Alphaproteobacteria bacterium]|jgi:anti-sigma B factor antagonist|nr:STAS domain-containing protein [Alphaproteobacteria bacterium]
MKHEVAKEQGLAVVAFSGDIDFGSSPEARRVLLDTLENEGGLLVNLAAVAYIDSSGVASLIEAFQSAKGSGNRFALIAVSDAAMRVLRLAHLERVFPIFDSVADAVADAG